MRKDKVAVRSNGKYVIVRYCRIVQQDYEAMSGMIFGLKPTVHEVVASISELEQRLNRSS
jgi:hypothetical protein